MTSVAPVTLTDTTDGRSAGRTSAADAAPPRWTRVAAYGLATKGDRLLLVRVAPGYEDSGRWTLPGGGLEWGEEPAAAALRELTEETGLTGEVLSVAWVDSFTGPPIPERRVGALHGVRIVFTVAITGGELRDEVDESTDAAAWVDLAEISQLPLVDLVRTALSYLEATSGED